jgi:predicted RNase H-like nuclease (RuvC/YqgF family)
VIDSSLLIGRNKENDMGFMDWLAGMFYPEAAHKAKEHERQMDNIDNGIENLMRNNETLSEGNKDLTRQLKSARVDCETISNLQSHCQELNREKTVLMEKAKRLQVEVHTLRQKLYEFIKLADRVWDVSHEELDEEELDEN